MTETVLSVDIGTTSLKAGLFTAEGEVVFVFRKNYDNFQSKNVALQWVNVFEKAFTKALKFSTNYDFQIKGITISGNGPTLVNENGLTVLWNGKNLPDEVYSSSIEKISNQLKEKKVFSLFLPRILLFKEVYPEEFNESKNIFSGPEYLIYKLTGSEVTILPENRYESAYWNDDLFKQFEIKNTLLPAFVPLGHNCGFYKDIPVFAGGPDFIVALIGTNTLEPGHICDRSGSSEGINFCVTKQIFADGIRTLPSVIPELWNCSVLIPDSSKLSVDERTKKLREAIQNLRNISAKNGFIFPESMKVTGGQTKNHFWMKEKAKTLKMNLEVCTCSDSELLGDSCIAWFGLGKYNSLQEAAKNIVQIKRVYKWSV